MGRARCERAAAAALGLAALVALGPGCGLGATLGALAAVSNDSGGGSKSPPPPGVSAVSPPTTTHAGGATLTISGANFAPGATVSIGGRSATEVVVLGPTALTARAPASSVAGAVDVVVTNAAGGAGTLSGGLTYTNDLPTATLDPLASPLSQNVVFGVSLRDPEADLIDLTLEYSVAGGPYQPLPAAQIVSGSPKGLASSTAGVSHKLTWSTAAAFGAQNPTGVRLRVTPVDTTDARPGPAVESSTFAITNNRAPTLELRRPADDSFEVAIAYRVVELDPTDALTLTAATWRDLRSGQTGNLSIKSGTPAAVPGAVPGSTSGVTHTLVWDSLPDLGYGNNRLVEVTFTLSDGVQAVSAASGSFFVSNGPFTDAVVNPSLTVQAVGLGVGDLTGDGKPDAVVATPPLRAYSLLRSSGQAFQAPALTNLLGFGAPVVDVLGGACNLVWDGTTTVRKVAAAGNPAPAVQVGDWLSLPFNAGGMAVGDPMGPRAFRVSAITASFVPGFSHDLTLDDPDGFATAGAGSTSLLPGAAALGGPTGGPFVTLRQAGQAGLLATSIGNDTRPAQVAVLSVDEDLSAVTSPTQDLVLGNQPQPVLATTATAIAGAQVTVQTLAPLAPFVNEQIQQGMLVQLVQSGIGAESRRVVAVDAATRVLTLASAPSLAFTAGAVVRTQTSADPTLANNLRNHRLIVIPQVGGALGAPSLLLDTGAAFTTDLVVADLAAPGGGAPDGKQDLVVVSSTSLTPGSTKGVVSVLLRNSAAAGFVAPAPAVTLLEVGLGGARPAASSNATVADITSDGLLDLVVANPGDPSVSLVVQGPAGTFTVAQTIDLSAFGFPPGDAQACGVGDLDGDGHVDVVVTGALSQRLLLLAGGDPPGPLVSLPAGNAARLVLTARQSPTPPPFLAGGATTQPAPTLYAGVGPRRLSIADVTADGRPEVLLVENGQDRCAVYVNRGVAAGVVSFDVVSFTTSLGPSDLSLGDVSGDGRLDLLVLGSLLGDVLRLQALVPGTLDRFVAFPVGGTPAAVEVAELTPSSPGPELVVVNAGDVSVTILGRDGAGGLTALSPIAGRTDVPFELQDQALLSPVPGSGPLRLVGANSVVAADMNSDGRLDLVVTTQASVPNGGPAAAVLLNEGGVAPIRTTTRVVVGVGGGVGGTAAQLVGSATPDIALVSITGAASGFVQLFSGGPGVSFTPNLPFSLGVPSATVPADLDLDGDLDLIVPLNFNFPLPNLAIFEQSPPGTLAARTDAVTGGITLSGINGTSFAAVADLNNDGAPDIAFSNLVNSRVGVAFRTAVAPPRFDDVISLLSLLEPAALAVGDLNGDGLADLAVTFAGDGLVGVYYQRPGVAKPPSAALDGPIFLAAGSSPFGLKVVDVNGDGRNDLAVTSRGSNTLNVFFQR